MRRVNELLGLSGAVFMAVGLALACGPAPGPPVAAIACGAALALVGSWAMMGALR